MAKKRLCIDFVAHADGNLVAAIFKDVILDECLKRLISEQATLNGRYLDPIVTVDEQFDLNRNKFNLRTRFVADQCQAKVVLCMYL
mmetsp:Transcript_34565/g.42577  ORF Transcript_34565/g.42577 Transcript_34565/m.42577 type:complete len:86 (-) Transcript_34565:23-280(-)